MRWIVLAFLLIFPGSAFALPPIEKVGDERYETVIGEHSDKILMGRSGAPGLLKAEAKLTRWNNENSLTIKYSGDFGEPEIVSGKLKGKKTKEDVSMYLKSEDEFEFEVILKEIPASNSWAFQLEGHEEFDFFYQDTLENDYANGTGIEIEPGEVLSEYLTRVDRPENVIGSYAVYHKTKRNHKTGGTNYATGKAFHIYRPKFIDADGATLWGEMTIEGGVLTITGDSTWLASAAYPVILDPTVGYSSLGASETNGSANGIMGVIGTTAGAGTLDKAYWGGRKPVSDFDIQIGVYDDSSTAPNNLVGNTASITIDSVGKQWWPAASPNGAAISGSLSASSTYWVSVYASATPTFAFDSGTGTNGFFKNSGQVFPTWPDPISGTSTSTARRSIYVEYTEDAGGGWTGKVNGVTNPAKVNGVSNANIASVSGV